MLLPQAHLPPLAKEKSSVGAFRFASLHCGNSIQFPSYCVSIRNGCWIASGAPASTGVTLCVPLSLLTWQFTAMDSVCRPCLPVVAPPRSHCYPLICIAGPFPLGFLDICFTPVPKAPAGLSLTSPRQLANADSILGVSRSGLRPFLFLLTHLTGSSSLFKELALGLFSSSFIEI